MAEEGRLRVLCPFLFVSPSPPAQIRRPVQRTDLSIRLPNQPYQTNIGGDVPSPRMGHSATGLPNGQVLLYGGTGHDNVTGGTTDTALAEGQQALYLLDTTAPTWSWSLANLSTSSLASPPRAWHTATLVNDTVILVAFGLDLVKDDVSGEIFFLSFEHDQVSNVTEWTWSADNPLAPRAVVGWGELLASEYAGEMAAQVQEESAASPLPLKLAPRQFLSDNTSQRPNNPKSAALADTFPSDPIPLERNTLSTVTSEAPSQTIETSAGTPLAIPSSSQPHNEVSHATSPSASMIVSSASQTSFFSTSTSQSSIPPSTTTSEAAATQGEATSGRSEAGITSTSHTSVIAGCVTAAFILALAAGLVTYCVRRRSGRKDKGNRNELPPGFTMMSSPNGNHTGDGQLPPVSLLHTKTVPRRMLSLGSTASIATSRGTILADDTQPYGPSRYRGENPFEDVDEFGRMAAPPDAQKYRTQHPDPAMSLAPTAGPYLRLPPLAHTSDSSSIRSTSESMGEASVASYPFLTSLPMLGSSSFISAPSSSSHYSHETDDMTNASSRKGIRRSRTVTTNSSGSTIREDRRRSIRAERRILSVSNAEITPSTAPLPSREFSSPTPRTRGTDAAPIWSAEPILEDPFADSEEEGGGGHVEQEVRRLHRSSIHDARQ